MANIKNNILETIGNTPLVRLGKTAPENANIFLKVEFFNPGGSVKDRVGIAMIEDAEKKGLLKAGGIIIEPTSGNTGVGLAIAAAVKNYKLILTMPDTMSLERRLLLGAYGAEIVLTPGAEGMAGSIAKALELQKQNPGSWIPQQFKNPANPAIHEETTGPEIWNAIDGNIDVFVAGVGTGGTISGVAKYLKSHKKDITVIAVEPDVSPILSGGQPAPHQLQGIGANFIPEVAAVELFDHIFTVSAKDAGNAARRLAQKEGILVGISSGAALHAAIQAAQMEEFKNKNIVVLLPDTGERYLSTWLFNDK